MIQYRFLFFTAIQTCLWPFGVVMLLASQAVFYNVIFGLLEGWLTFNWKGGSVSIGKVAQFRLEKWLTFILEKWLTFERKFHIILAVSNNCRIFATRISATPLIQAYQGGTYFFIDAMQYTN